jgi:hypothetical protein
VASLRVDVAALAMLALPVAAAGQTWRYAEVNFPAALDTFVNQSTHRWIGRPELGMSLTYVIPGDDATELTIYVYPIRPADTTATHGSAVGERDVALNEIQTYAEKYRDLSEFHVDSVGPFMVQSGNHSYNGAYAAVLMRFDKTRVTSLLYVFVRDRTYLKVRLSYLESAGAAVQPHILPLIRQALTAIAEPAR